MTDSDGKNVLLFIDESYDEDFCAVCVVCVQGEKNITLLRDKLRQLSIDPSVAIYNPSQKLHYAENSISTRQSLVRWLVSMPISVYIGVKHTDLPIQKDDLDVLAYKQILPELLKPLGIKFGNRFAKNSIELNFENLSDKPTVDLSFFTTSAELGGFDNTNVVKVVTKNSEPLIALPDYFLGFIHDLHLKKGNETWFVDSLKLLSDKIGLVSIFDKTTVTHFGRGNQVEQYLQGK